MVESLKSEVRDDPTSEPTPKNIEVRSVLLEDRSERHPSYVCVISHRWAIFLAMAIARASESLSIGRTSKSKLWSTLTRIFLMLLLIAAKASRSRLHRFHDCLSLISRFLLLMSSSKKWGASA